MANMQKQLNSLSGNQQRQPAAPVSPTTPKKPRRPRRVAHEPPLLTELRGLLAQADRLKEPPSTSQIVEKLTAVLARAGAPPSSSPAGPRGPAPAAAAKLSPPPQGQRSFHKVWALDWGGAKIIQATAAPKATIIEPVVIACQSDHDYDKVMEWRRATGCTVACTFVVFNSAKAPLSDVLVEGPRGPTTQKAWLEGVGSGAPVRSKLPQSVKDDTAEPAPKVATFSVRITVSDAYAENALFGRARQEPLALPALVFSPEACKHIQRVKAAIDYTSEVTCVAIVRETGRSDIMGGSLPTGVFCNEQGTTLVPRWFPQKSEETASVYYNRVLQLATGASGRLVFRPSLDAALGVVAKKVIIDADSVGPRWCIQRAPEGWTNTDEVEAWITARGFVNVSSVARSGRRRWFFRGDLADCPDRSAFQFSSGVTVSMVLSGPKKKRDDEASKPKSTWGAPASKHAPAAPTPEAEGGDHAMDTAEAAPAAEPAGTPPASTPAAGTGRKGPPLAGAPKDKKAKTTPPKPFAEHFDTVDCGGAGDCFYLSSSRGIHALSRHPKALKKEDTDPGGNMQASLRLIMASELRKRPKHYDVPQIADIVEKLSTAGQAATSMTVHATAVGSSTEFAIWAKSPSGHWTLYLPPKPPAGSKYKQAVWLVLESRHYQWLRPKAAAPLTKEKDKEWRAAALPYPTDFTGAGRGTTDPDLEAAKELLGITDDSDDDDSDLDAARSLLGLSAPSSRRGRTARARSFLGCPEEQEAFLAKRSPRIQPAFCDLIGTEGSRRETKQGTVATYKCVRCGLNRTLAEARRCPCTARANKQTVSRAQFLASSLGPKKAKAQRATHAAAQRKCNADWRSRNPERLAKLKRESRQRHRDAILARERKYYQKNKTLLQQKARRARASWTPERRAQEANNQFVYRVLAKRREFLTPHLALTWLVLEPPRVNVEGLTSQLVLNRAVLEHCRVVSKHVTLQLTLICVALEPFRVVVESFTHHIVLNRVVLELCRVVLEHLTSQLMLNRAVLEHCRVVSKQVTLQLTLICVVLEPFRVVVESFTHHIVLNRVVLEHCRVVSKQGAMQLTLIRVVLEPFRVVVESFTHHILLNRVVLELCRVVLEHRTSQLMLNRAVLEHCRVVSKQVTLQLTLICVALEPFRVVVESFTHHIVLNRVVLEHCRVVFEHLTSQLMMNRARVRCLESVHSTRLDAAGVARVDVDASSTAVWAKWHRSLSHRDKKFLDIFRSGATKTPTRGGEAAPCPWCRQPLASLRHMFQDCPRFDTERAAIARDLRLPSSFWRTQPRVTAKSGWITYDAGRTPERRGTMQVAACRLGLAIVAATFDLNGGSSFD
ncbi:unnamed protein product [Prorocentrum cordatum]|uniref:Uncharacterized protein n=1 Tax=Prorocentrum cordatum TaxID=2364126 RepID=A0ABN9UZI6_9DINO|nr:unnamed protein product [Polarella glacialis]